MGCFLGNCFICDCGEDSLNLIKFKGDTIIWGCCGSEFENKTHEELK